MRCPSQESVNPCFEERLKAYEREAKAASKTQGQGIFPGKICACSMAASAVLGLAQPALSAIVYSGPQNIPAAGFVPVDFQGIGASADFVFFGMFYSYAYYGYNYRAAGAFLYPLNGNSMLSSGFLVRNMNAGSPVSSGAGNWDSGFGLLNAQYEYFGYSYSYGNFVNTTGYIGVRISAGGGDYYYGWIQYRGDADFTTKAGTIIDWAYEDQVNTPIRAGDKGEEPIPTLNEWGMIMLAALLAGYGMLRLRRQGDDPVAGA